VGDGLRAHTIAAGQLSGGRLTKPDVWRQKQDKNRKEIGKKEKKYD
jgi:hypothetical protein